MPRVRPPLCFCSNFDQVVNGMFFGGRVKFVRILGTVQAAILEDGFVGFL